MACSDRLVSHGIIMHEEHSLFEWLVGPGQVEGTILNLSVRESVVVKDMSSYS